MKKMKIYVLQSTHWDREWYQPFQGFRYNLVEMLDGLVDILERDGDFGLFCTDGQTVLLEDYKEICPENAKKLEKYIKEGRVKVGPWYVMPDEFSLSGESLIRNLAYGHKVAKRWGTDAWKFGYVNDVFGHVAQMPQIFRGFGIKGAYTSRGTGNTDKNALLWVSPDGSECSLTVGSYSKFAVGYKNSRDTAECDKFIKGWVDTVIERTDAPVIFLSYTHDHTRADPRSAGLISDLKRLYPDAEVGFFDLAEMSEELLEYKDAFPKFFGELNYPLEKRGGDTDNYPSLFGAVSSYYPLKYRNDRCQNILEKRIEPILALMNIEGTPIKRRFVELAYEYLMKNHPHDSICGCSIDRVHTVMLYRFDLVGDITNRLYDEFLFVNHAFDKEAVDRGLKIRLYNLTPYEFRGVRRADIAFFADYPERRTGVAYYDPVNNFKIRSASGDDVEYQIIDIKRGVEIQDSPYVEAAALRDVYTVSLYAEIPPFGFSEYSVYPTKERQIKRKTMKFGANFAENEHIRLEIKENGNLTVTDKTTGKAYSDLCSYIDDGEVGDGWRHQELKLDKVVSDSGSAVISIVSSGVNEISFLIEKEMLLPKYLDGYTFKRSDERAALRIKSTVTLGRSDSFVTVESEIENNIKDHRLRVTFPTDTDGEKYFASQAFCFLERPTGIDYYTDTWIEPYSLEQNTSGIVGKVGTDGAGLALISAYGIHECSCNDDERSTLSLTLLRSFDRVRRQRGAEGAQIQGTHRYKYAIAPLSHRVDYGELCRIMHGIADTDPSFTVPSSLSEPAVEKSYFSIDNKDIILSIFKCAEDGEGYILRLYNASSTDTVARLSLNGEFTRALECNLNEDAVGEYKLECGSLEMHFSPWQIKTVKLI